MDADLRFVFSIHGFVVAVESKSAELIARLENDFVAFPRADLQVAPLLRILAEFGGRPVDMPEDERRFRRSRNCLILDQGSIRWNNYGDEAWVRYDFESHEALVKSENIERLHELCYLLALSRAGKALDRDGLHRIHAMAVASPENRVLVLCMPMKGGKTTSFLRLLDHDPALRPVSDDSPLVDRSGAVSRFYLRVGLDPENARTHAQLRWINWTRSYCLERMRYGRKILLPASALGREPFSERSESVVLVQGIRFAGKKPRVMRAGVLTLLPTVLSNLVVGLGLPMMREYFLENRPGDLRTCLRILWSRMRAAQALLSKSEKYRIYLGTDHEANARELQALLRGSVLGG